MKPVLSNDEKEILGMKETNDPKIILSLNIQVIGNNTAEKQSTTSVALEV
jgi:hypothetical protein